MTNQPGYRLVEIAGGKHIDPFFSKWYFMSNKQGVS